ncbi:site-specific DNA-methyltransferase [Catenulispora pinisilvae]|uniref:site-specific DNA-methyltransferase n=1 Tax=Catenulispora pinisilvae TaxID=2705253 RepID=UPI0018921164|nr:site-specific DNA-methyltransferase [Catenulispora pinisilvae]
MRPHASRQRSVATLARQAITTYTDQDSLLLDPICGSGDILVEAVRAGRMAIGVEHEPYWVDMARTRIERATDSGRGGFAAVVNGSVDTLVRMLAGEDRSDRASMVLTAPQTGTTLRADDEGTASNIAEFIAGSVSSVSRCTQVTAAQSLHGVICWPVPSIDIPWAIEEVLTAVGFTLVDRQTVGSTSVSLLLLNRPDMGPTMPERVDQVDFSGLDR